jgi:hypothetical protein
MLRAKYKKLICRDVDHVNHDRLWSENFSTEVNPIYPSELDPHCVNNKEQLE